MLSLFIHMQAASLEEGRFMMKKDLIWTVNDIDRMTILEFTQRARDDLYEIQGFLHQLDI